MGANVNLLGLAGILIVGMLALIIWLPRRAYAQGLKQGYITGRSTLIGDRIEKIAKGEEPMTAELFEAQSLSTWNGPMPGTPFGFMHLTLKLAGETGEFCEHVGKALRDDDKTLQDFQDGFVVFTDARRTALKKELGDILWYIVVLAWELKFNIIEIMVANVLKLRDRHARGKMKGAGDDR